MARLLTVDRVADPTVAALTSPWHAPYKRIAKRANVAIRNIQNPH